MRKSIPAGALLFTAAFLGSAHPVVAETVTFNFTGTVMYVEPDVPVFIEANISVGNQVTGSFAYDLNSPGTVGNLGAGTATDYSTPVPPGKMTYHVGKLSVTAPIGGTVVTSVGLGVQSQIDEYAPGGPNVDSFRIGAETASPATLATFFRLEDTSETVYSDMSLPASLDIHAFDLRRFDIYWVHNGIGYPVYASIDSISMSPTQATGRVLYVANNGTDSVNCGNVGRPCRSIGQAIANAVDGDQIEVGPGVYGDLNADGDLDDPGEETPRLDENGRLVIVDVNKRLGIYSQEGADATTIRLSPVSNPEMRIDIVRITHADVIVGRPNGGFTVLGGANTVGITSLASRVRIVGNIALNNGNAGFLFLGGINGTQEINGNKVIDNVALGGGFAGGGFDVARGTRNFVFDANVAIGGGLGFLLEGGASRHLVKNCRAIGNGTGFVADDDKNTFLGNSAIGNIGSGFIIFAGRGNVLHGNNIFGNGTGLDVISGNLATNCGVKNQTTHVVDATGNYWGAASGPGSDPADNAGPGSGCDENKGSSTLTTPFAAKPFPIN